MFWEFLRVLDIFSSRGDQGGEVVYGRICFESISVPLVPRVGLGGGSPSHVVPYTKVCVLLFLR